MDNLTHSLAGALLGQMGLKRASRFALAGCILGANAPDIDVIAPLFLPVDNIAFHRGPTHALFGLPVMAAGTVVSRMSGFVRSALLIAALAEAAEVAG